MCMMSSDSSKLCNRMSNTQKSAYTEVREREHEQEGWKERGKERISSRLCAGSTEAQGMLTLPKGRKVNWDYVQ